MTTEIKYKFYLLGVALMLGAAPFAVWAQINELSASDVTNAGTTTEAIFETAAEEMPWFKLEKLTGVVDQGDFVVGPGRVELELKPGQSAVYEISVANRISDDREFRLAVEDVSGTSDGKRAMVFMGEEEGPYTIKDYLSFPYDTFTLDLGDRARIPVTISVPEDAEPGGYYGGVLVSTIKNDAETDGASARSPIVARVGTLFFITVPGEVQKSGATKQITLADKKTFYEKGPFNFLILFENTGSVHLNPYGEIRIKNMFGEEVGFVELEPWFVLPQSLRTRDLEWTRELLFGRYTATAFINRGYDDVIDEVAVTFYVLPWKVLLPIFLLLFVIIFSIRFVVKTFEFKRRS
jgi:hypothetical protein